MISVGSGREAAFSAAVLGDNALMERAWQETGMLAEAVLHAHVWVNQLHFPHLVSFYADRTFLLHVLLGSWKTHSKELGRGME